MMGGWLILSVGGVRVEDEFLGGVGVGEWLGFGNGGGLGGFMFF